MLKIQTTLPIFIVLLIQLHYGLTQRTILDDKFTPSYQIMRRAFLNFVGRSGNSRQYFDINKKMGKLQNQYPSSTPFFCDTKGPGRRSHVQPQSIHELRPGDIDIIGAMGDSLTAANGAMATNILQVTTENKGISFSIGGQSTWRKFLTIPNILKEFNPNLYGYALADGLSIDRSARFNVAELGAMSRDMPHQAKVLVQRMKADPNVNMTHHWKLVSILIGANDFCADMCYYNNPKSILNKHTNDLIQTLRILRDNIPRLMVNIISTPSMKILTQFKGLPSECFAGLHFECPCVFGTRVHNSRTLFFKIMKEWNDRDIDTISHDEFNRKDFTVNYQRFTKNIKFPLKKNNLTDFTYMSTDCFHLSQKGYARAANALWNNMLEPEGKKLENWTPEFEHFICPTEKRPYLATRQNS